MIERLNIQQKGKKGNEEEGGVRFTLCFIKKGSQPVEEVTFSAVANRYGRKWV